MGSQSVARGTRRVNTIQELARDESGNFLVKPVPQRVQGFAYQTRVDFVNDVTTIKDHLLALIQAAQPNVPLFSEAKARYAVRRVLLAIADDSYHNASSFPLAYMSGSALLTRYKEWTELGVLELINQCILAFPDSELSTVIWEQVKDRLILDMHAHFYAIDTDMRSLAEYPRSDLVCEALILEKELCMPYNMGWCVTLGQPATGEMFHTLSTRSDSRVSGLPMHNSVRAVGAMSKHTPLAALHPNEIPQTLPIALPNITFSERNASDNTILPNEVIMNDPPHVDARCYLEWQHARLSPMPVHPNCSFGENANIFSTTHPGCSPFVPNLSINSLRHEFRLFFEESPGRDHRDQPTHYLHNIDSKRPYLVERRTLVPPSLPVFVVCDHQSWAEATAAMVGAARSDPIIRGEDEQRIREYFSYPDHCRLAPADVHILRFLPHQQASNFSTETIDSSDLLSIVPRWGDPYHNTRVRVPEACNLTHT